MPATSALDLLQAALESEASVTAKVADRIFAIELPQKAAFPALVLHLVEERDVRMLAGAAQYPVARLIVDCIGETFAQATTTGAVIKDALRDWSGVAAGFDCYFEADDIDHFDRGESGKLWRRRIGFQARFRAAA